MENQTPNPDANYPTQQASPIVPPPSDPANVGPKTAYPTPRFLSKNLAIIALILIGILFLGGAYFAVNQNNETEEVACTMEAKICPDGSSVGRTGPKCEFTPCPASPSASNAANAAETANWKTYVGSGFSLKYPQDWKVIENSTDSARFYPPTSDPNIPSDMISFVKNQSKPFSSVKPIPITSDPVSIIVDGVTGWENEDNGKLPPFSHYAALPLNKGFIFFQSPKGLTSVLKQILSTFKFTK